MPVAIEIAADLLLLCAVIVLIGMSKALQYTLVSLLRFLARAAGSAHIPFTHIGIPGSGWLAHHLDDAANWLYNQIGVGILALEHTAVWFWHGLTALAVLLGEQIKGLAYDLEWVYRRVEKFTVPYWINRLQRWVIGQIVAFAHHPIRYLRHALAEIRHDAVAVGHAVAALPGEIAHEAKVRASSVAGTLTHVPSWVGKRIGTVEREVTAESRGRFSWLERLALGSLAAGVALKLLERVAPWVRCRNVNTVGRHLCRLPVKALEDLLAGIVDVLLIADICRIVTLMTQAARLAAPEIELLSSGVAELIRCQNAERPAALPVAFYAPPAVTSSLALG